MIKKPFFWLFLAVLSFNNKHLFAFEKSALNEASNDSIIKTENVSKLLETRDFLFIENGKRDKKL